MTRRDYNVDPMSIDAALAREAVRLVTNFHEELLRDPISVGLIAAQLARNDWMPGDNDRYEG